MKRTMGCIDRIITIMDRGSLGNEKTKEEVTKKSEVILSDELILNQIQPVTTDEGKNEIPLIESDMETEVMACDGEEAPLTSMEKLPHITKKKTRWKLVEFRKRSGNIFKSAGNMRIVLCHRKVTNWVCVIHKDEAQQQLDVKHGNNNVDNDLQRDYSVLTKDDLKEKMNKQIDDLCEMLLRSKSDATVLLTKLQWDSQHVSERLSENTEKLLMGLGFSAAVTDSNYGNNFFYLEKNLARLTLEARDSKKSSKNLYKLWKRDLEYLDTGQNDLKKEKKKKSSKKMKLSVEDVKIDNPNVVLKFKITDPLREKLQATTSEMVLGGADLVGKARTGQGSQEIKLKRGADIVVGTPACIKDHTERHNIATRALHGDIQQSQRKITRAGFRKGQIGGAGNTGVVVMLCGSRKSGVSRIEKQTGKRFEHVSVPQPNDIAKAVCMEAAEKIIQDCDDVVPALMTASKEVADEYGEGDKPLRNCLKREMVKEKDGNRKTQVIGESEIELFEKDEDLVLDQKEFETLYHHEEKSAEDIIMGQSRISVDSAEKNNKDRMKIGQSCVEYENLEIFLKLALEDPCILAHKENESLRIVWRTLGLKTAASYFRSYVNTCKVLRIVNAKVETFELGKTRVPNLRPRKSDIRTDRRYERDPRTWEEKKENEGSGLRRNEPGQVCDQKDPYLDILKQQRLRDVEMQQQRSHETESSRATNLDRERREHKTSVDERTRSGYPVRQGERICRSYPYTGLCVYEPEGKEDVLETNPEKPEDSTKTEKKLLAESKKEKAHKGSTKTAVDEVEFNKSEHGEELVSKRANIWWSLDKKFYDGVLKSYKRLNKMNHVSYWDGDSEEFKNERWEIISDEEVSKFSRVHGKFRDVVRSVHSDIEEHGGRD
ncbi:hypothetical protein Bca101_026419 [Brassica carinata]